MCITIMVLSLAVVFSGLMVENMIVDMQPFIDLIVGGIVLLATLSDDFSDMNNQSVCVEGRYPRYDNEIKDCLLTRSGYERMGELQNASYYIDLTDGEDIFYTVQYRGRKRGMAGRGI